MVNQAAIQAHVAYGFSISASKLGSPYTQFRPTTAMNPLLQPPYATLNAYFDANAKFPLTSGAPLSKPTQFALMNTTDVQVGDILVGAHTYFISEWDPIEPAQVQLCNLTLSIYTTSKALAAGDNPYGGRTESTDVDIAAGWPAAMVAKNKGQFDNAKLPDDVRSGNYEILLPPIPGVVIAQGMRIRDIYGVEYMVGGVEPLAYGCWKFIAEVATT